MSTTDTALAKVSVNYDLTGITTARPNANELVLAAQRITVNDADPKMNEMLSKLSIAIFNSFASKENPNVISLSSTFDKSIHDDYSAWKKAVRFVFSELLREFNIPSATLYIEDKPEIIQPDRRFF